LLNITLQVVCIGNCLFTYHTLSEQFLQQTNMLVLVVHAHVANELVRIVNTDATRWDRLRILKDLPH
jgi:hypothetical protein